MAGISWHENFGHVHFSKILLQYIDDLHFFVYISINCGWLIDSYGQVALILHI